MTDDYTIRDVISDVYFRLLNKCGTTSAQTGVLGLIRLTHCVINCRLVQMFVYPPDKIMI